ncbi:periplasmic binding protein-like I [Obelidium mucronatum]|nr:periplasmic binding protein-like I [Obelidium mucronatum]
MCISFLLLLSSAALVHSQSIFDPIIGFFPGTSNITAKYQNNITIAFMLPYHTFWDIPDAPSVNPDATWYMQMDASAELAVLQANNNSDVLPNTMVNILRVNNWNPITDKMELGGTALVAMKAVLDPHNISGIYIKTVNAISLIAAGVFSELQIPACGGDQNDPALSDKTRYPYFIRPTYSSKWGLEFTSLLLKWNVRRAAIVYDGTDKESAGGCLDVKTSFFNNGIIVLSYRNYKDASHFDSILSDIKALDARYIVFCSQGWSISYDFIQRANQTGLISRNHVWLVSNPPLPQDYAGYGDDPRFRIFDGMMLPVPNFKGGNDPNYRIIEKQWNDMYEQDKYKYQTTSLNWASAGGYDCAGTLIYGFDDFLKRDTSITPAMLKSHQLQSRLKHQAFSNISFKGINLNPMRLDSNGDVLVDTVMVSITDHYWIHGGQPPFAIIDKKTGAYNAVTGRKPFFFGNTSIPPVDGPPSAHASFFAVDSSTFQGRVIIALMAVGYILCISAAGFAIALRNNPTGKSMNVGQTVVSLMGSLLMVTSLFFYLRRATSGLCYSRYWLAGIGFNMMVVPIVGKSWLVHKVFTAKVEIKKVLKRLPFRLHAATGVVVVCQMVYLILWQMQQDFLPKQYYIDNRFIFECTTSTNQSQPIISLIIAHNITLILAVFAAAYLTKDLNPKYNECSFLIVFGVVSVILGALCLQLEVTLSYPLQQSICVFIVAVTPPLVLVFPKSVVWVWGRLEGVGVVPMGAQTKSSGGGGGNGGNNAAVKYIKSLKEKTGFTGSSASASYDATRIGVISENVQLYQPPLRTLCDPINIRTTYKTQNRIHLLGTTVSIPIIDSKWKTLQSISICQSREKVWLMLRSEEETECFAIIPEKTVAFLDNGTNVRFALDDWGRVYDGGYQVVFEFEVEREGQEFLRVIDSVSRLKEHAV